MRRNIKGGIDSSTYFIVLLSPDSIKSKWVRFELREALEKNESLEGGPVIIPALIKECKVPKRIEDKLQVDFTKGWGLGFTDLLRGICRKSQIIMLTIDKNKPLQLETNEFNIWIEEYLHQEERPLLFVLDDHGLLNEMAMKGEGRYYDMGAVSRDLRVSRLLIENLCLILPKYVKILRELSRSDNYFMAVLPEALQRLCRLVLYKMYTEGIQQAFNNGVNGAFADLISINANNLLEEFEVLNPGYYNEPPVFRMIQANILGIDNPIDLDLIGKLGITNVCPILLADGDLSPFVKRLWQLENFSTNEISEATWLKKCMPQIAAEHVYNIAIEGKSIAKFIDTIGLKPNDYQRIGPH